MIGTRIGRYLITAELGQGGMGTVYKATHVTLNRTVALKVLFPHLARSREYLGRFRREAVTLARVAHENIVQIYDIEEFDGSSCIVMEYVAGPSLTRMLSRERRMEPGRARDIAVALCGALDAAHRQGIVHRDIKPDNILFTAEGRAKLTDFGIAHMRDDNVHTRTGVMLGTPYYMSPEQARGRPVTAASDLYSLGVVLYEMLAGRLPFSAEDALGVALQHVQEMPPPLVQVAPWAPAPLAALVHRMLEKDPSHRLAGARELERALTGLDLAASPGGTAVAEPAALPPCPECGASIQAEFLTCPYCALAVRQRCGRCERFFDPLSPECPFCRTPVATPAAVLAAEPPAPSPAGPPTVAAAAPAAVQGSAEPERRVHPRIAAVVMLLTAWTKRLRATAAAAAAGGALRRAADAARQRFATAGAAGLPLPIWIGAALVLVGLIGAVAVAMEGPRAMAAADRAPPGPAPVFSPQNAPPRRPGQPEHVPTAEERERAGRVLEGLLLPADSADDGIDDAPADTADSGARPSAPDTSHARSDQPPEANPAPVTVPGNSEPSPSAFDESAARAEIEQIVERQRLATEAGNLELLLQDVATELHDEVRRSFQEMHGSARDITSRIRDVRIRFGEGPGAEVAFAVRINAVRRSDGRNVTIFDGRVNWRLERRDDRWLIVSAG